MLFDFMHNVLHAIALKLRGNEAKRAIELIASRDPEKGGRVRSGGGA